LKKQTSFQCGKVEKEDADKVAEEEEDKVAVEAKDKDVAKTCLMKTD
jgi:hypothetical protein